MKGYYYFLLLLTVHTSLLKSQDIQVDYLLELNNALEKKATYDQERAERIKALKTQFSKKQNRSDEGKFALYEDLFDSYRLFIYDSAFSYADKMIDLSYKLKDETKIANSKTQLGFILLSSGKFKETLDTLSTVDVRLLNDSVKIVYYRLMSRTYFDLCDYDEDAFYCDAYTKASIEYLDQAFELMDSESYDYHYLKGLKYLRVKDYSNAANELTNILNNYDLDHNQLAITTSTLSYLRLLDGDTTAAINLLARACTADIISSTKETRAMANLAELLYLKGNVLEAYDYITNAMENAEFYGARQRKNQIVAILPFIAASRLNKMEVQRSKLIFYVVGLTILALVIGLFSWIVSAQYRKLKIADKVIKEKNDYLEDVNHKLEEATKIKEEYIGYYFNINSEYLDKIDKFKKLIEQKVANKRYDEIKYVVNNINVKKEREELYFSFDKVFLKLFPNFVTIFNSYFNKEDQLLPEKDQLLNSELRILALIRMGITDSDKLAKILNYSVNTIYTYKNRMKSKFLPPKEEFEQRIMEIKTN